MKQSGPELGPLSSRLFSYIQLKKKHVLKTGEIVQALGISPLQERELLRRLSRSGWILRLKRGVYLAPLRLPGGGKFSPGIAVILERVCEQYNGRYQISGQAAFNRYGFDDQIAVIPLAYNNFLSGVRTFGSLTVQFVRVTDHRLGATALFPLGNESSLIYSSKARTLMDAVYDWKRFNSLPRAYEWIIRFCGNDTKLLSDLVAVTCHYGNQATIKRVGHLLDSMKSGSGPARKLLDLVRNKNALVPFIPGRPSRGPVDTTWGIIANE